MLFVMFAPFLNQSDYLELFVRAKCVHRTRSMIPPGLAELCDCPIVASPRCLSPVFLSVTPSRGLPSVECVQYTLKSKKINDVPGRFSDPRCHHHYDVETLPFAAISHRCGNCSDV